MKKMINKSHVEGVLYESTLEEKDSKSLNEPVELNITSIIKKGFKSNPVELKQNNTIRASKDNLVELDITVDYVKKPLS